MKGILEMNLKGMSYTSNGLSKIIYREKEHDSGKKRMGADERKKQSKK